MTRINKSLSETLCSLSYTSDTEMMLYSVFTAAWQRYPICNHVHKNVQLSRGGPFNKRQFQDLEAGAIFFLSHFKMPRRRPNARDEIYDFIRLNCVLNNSACISLHMRVCEGFFFPFPAASPTVPVLLNDYAL